MMYPAIRKALAVVACFGIIISSNAINAQADSISASEISSAKPPKPFRILTEGKQITIKSTQDISRILVWTQSGNRYIEQTNVNAPSYNFTIPAKEKFVFVMLQMKNGKHYTQKVGAQ